ncbi:MAG: ABC transporter permease, partial [Dehalococcoidales bacterium]|nr:ABC transporter permease [Dehalococcoidales bacterium]
MNSRTIKALLKKDLALFMSNRFYMIVTAVGIVFYIGIYFLMPAGVDESFSFAMYMPEAVPAFGQLAGQDGMEIEYFSDEESLKQAVLDKDYQVAISLPADIVETWSTGGKPDITIYYASIAPEEVKDIVVTLVKELSFAQTGQSLNFNTTQEILGPDMLGDQISMRDRMRPLLAAFIILFEILTMASLISVEIDQGTARALLITPMGISDLFFAKGILGIGLAFTQAILFMLVVGGFSNQPLI